MTGDDKIELMDKLNSVNHKELEEFVNLPCFDNDDLGVFFIIAHAMPDITIQDMVDDWGISETLATFLCTRIVSAMIFLGAD